MNLLQYHTIYVIISSRTATSAPHTRPTQRLSRPPPIQKLGAKNHMLQLNIQCSWWWAYIPETSRVKNTYLLTYSMVQSPSWEANWFEASQEIPRTSRNPNVHYRTHKRLPPVSILGQPNPVHIPTSHILEIHPNIIHPSTPRSPHWSPSLLFPHQDPIHPLSSPIRATCSAHLIWAKNILIKLTFWIKLTFQIISRGRCTVKQPSNIYLPVIFMFSIH